MRARRRNSEGGGVCKADGGRSEPGVWAGLGTFLHAAGPGARVKVLTSIRCELFGGVFEGGAKGGARRNQAWSVGLNFGSEGAAGGEFQRGIPPEPRVPLALRELAAEIFAFDVIVQNYDRKADNPNLLWDRATILAIDHEGALGPILRQGQASLASLELDKFYDHVFYSAVSAKDAGYHRLRGALERLSPGRMEELLGEIPVQWQVGEDFGKDP